ncbi:MAG TPA: hypothetical protein VFI25_03360 [Planctomycetota bacterium]|nr:hypothetical protein [Planctomycetota bacterium]
MVLFVGEYRFPAHGFDPSPFDRALEMLRGTEGETHAFFSHDAEGDGFDERALFADLVAAPLFAPARAIAVRRAERLCKFAGRTRKQGERTEFEAASLRFLEGERDGSLLLVSLPTKTEKDPLAADLLGKGGIVVVCPGPEGEEANGFALASALVEGKSPQALRILETIRRDGLALAPGRRERDPRALYAILFARMYESARRAAEVRRLLDGGVPIREAAASVGSKGWPGSDLDLAARARNPAGHERLLRALRALEVAVKSGREPDALAAIGRLAAAFGGGPG